MIIRDMDYKQYLVSVSKSNQGLFMDH